MEQRGIEPLTSALRTRRSAKLSYCPTRSNASWRLAARTRIQFQVSSFKFHKQQTINPPDDVDVFTSPCVTALELGIQVSLNLASFLSEATLSRIENNIEWVEVSPPSTLTRRERG